MLDEDTSSIVIRSNNNQIAINVKQFNTVGYKRKSKENMNKDSLESLIFPSVLIEFNGLEINIRKSHKIISNRSKSVCHIEKKIKSSQSYWDYSSLHGPNMWSRIFPQLQCKKFQSPICIYTNQCKYEPILSKYPFIFDTDENCCQILKNTGYSFHVSGNSYSYITGGPVSDEYQFLQFHMHWGSNNNEGSEHVIDGIRLPGELHIVTWNTSQYKTPQEAVTSERFGGLMIFAILIKIIPIDNPNMSKLINLFSKIMYKGEKINLDSNIISLKNLLPENIQDYYTYNGSLTTPMCHESVRWIIFRENIGLSENQFNQLRQLKKIYKNNKISNECIQNNYRPLMPLNGRTIYRSFD